MKKSQAVESLGQHRLMMPAWVRAALSANDRLKVYLTVLQTAAMHAAHPKRDLPDLTKEIAATSLASAWLHDVVVASTKIDEALLIPDLARLVKGLSDDLATMARPVLETTPAGADSHTRVQHWLNWLAALPADHLNDQQLEGLTHGRRGGPDSLHLLVMDLHKQINHLSG